MPQNAAPRAIERPLVARTWHLAEIASGIAPLLDSTERARLQCVPVRHQARPIAVVSREAATALAQLHAHVHGAAVEVAREVVGGQVKLLPVAEYRPFGAKRHGNDAPAAPVIREGRVEGAHAHGSTASVASWRRSQDSACRWRAGRHGLTQNAVASR